MSADATRPNSAIVVARASFKSNLPEDLFVVDEYKQYDGDFYKLFDWLDATLKRTCANAEDATIWLHPDSAEFASTINAKLKYRVELFKGDAAAGIAEANWYMLETEKAHPFTVFEKASHMYWLMHPAQMEIPTPDFPHGFYHARQEMATWSFNDKGDPTKVGSVLDCLRMVCAEFRTYAEPMSLAEEREQIIKTILPVNNGGQEFQIHDHKDQQTLEAAKMFADDMIREKHGDEVVEFEEEPVNDWWND